MNPPDAHVCSQPNISAVADRDLFRPPTSPKGVLTALRPHRQGGASMGATPFDSPSTPARRHLRWLFCLAGIVLTLCGCSRPPVAPKVQKPLRLSGPTMGTQYSIVLADVPADVHVVALQSAVDARLERINDLMSTYRETSELSRFNASASTDWFPVSTETSLVVAEALRISDVSDGAFDATVGPLVNLWSFGPDPRVNHAPDAAALEAARMRVGYRMIEVRHDPPALRKTQDNVSLDLSGIAKGFGVDEIARLLDESGIGGYLVEIGGETRTKGSKDDGSVWRIGIESPLTEERRVQRVVELRDQSLATSGDYRNYFEENGTRFSHTIDPRTGEPIMHTLASVSVVAENCMLADALATTIMVLGPEAGYNLALEHDLSVYMIIRSGDRFVEKSTPSFEPLFAATRSE